MVRYMTKIKLNAKGFLTVLYAIATQGQKATPTYTQEFLYGITGLESYLTTSYLLELEDAGYIQLAQRYEATKKSRTVANDITFLALREPKFSALYSIIYNRILGLQTLGFLDYLTEIGEPQGDSFVIQKTVREMFGELGVASATVQKELKRLIELGLLVKEQEEGRKKVTYKLRFTLNPSNRQLLMLPPLARDLYMKYSNNETQGITLYNLNGNFYDKDLPNFYGYGLARNVTWGDDTEQNIIPLENDIQPYQLQLPGYVLKGEYQSLATLFEIEQRNRIKRELGIVTIYLTIFERLHGIARASGEPVVIHICEQMDSHTDRIQATVTDIVREIKEIAKRDNWLLMLR